MIPLLGAGTARAADGDFSLYEESRIYVISDAPPSSEFLSALRLARNELAADGWDLPMFLGRAELIQAVLGMFQRIFALFTGV